ncbi:efflux RND transporter periplasmic adaptor subunit [Microvirga antarctica]|uniref:efflux RND transporter periplasmic adaptor subunit n=1 Tax=Microvirga antarctica TaxID=2819233 RepID=UPI001B302CF6|nr:efflux RND transporter periplasmic adaptor subunit [Microvirga antarctica]
MRVAVLAILVAGLAMPVLAMPALAQQPAPAAVPVGTVSAAMKPIAKTLDFVGRVEAPERVEIRARVKGFLDEVLFTEGAVVQKGTPLYRIEPGLFEADVERAQGALERSTATHALAVIQLQRAEDLLAKAAGTAVARDQARAQEQEAMGAVTTSKADLTTAQINLGYTQILSPIAGRIGRTSVTKGNVVGPDSGVLTTIVSQDPMYVTFPVSQREFLRGEETGRPVDPKSLKVQIVFPDGTIYDQTGRLDFLDVSVDRTTDTLLVRAVMPNPKFTLTDGQLVRVLLENREPENRIVIPQAALIADQGGVYVFIVEDGKAAMRRVKLGAETGSGVIITEGVSVGDPVIVEGLQSVRAGIPVRATPLPRSLSGM